MNVISLFLFIFLSLITIAQSQVYNGDAFLATQAEVDAFTIYAEVTGRLFIKEMI